MRRQGGVPFDHVGKPSKDDAAHDALRQRVTPGGGAMVGGRLRLSLALIRRQALLRVVAIAGVDAIDGDVLALDEGDEVSSGAGDPAARRFAEHHTFATPGHALRRLECQVGAALQRESHEPLPGSGVLAFSISRAISPAIDSAVSGPMCL